MLAGGVRRNQDEGNDGEPAPASCRDSQVRYGNVFRIYYFAKTTIRPFTMKLTFCTLRNYM